MIITLKQHVGCGLDNCSGCTKIKRILDICQEIILETKGNPSMILFDGISYKPIPTTLADRLESWMEE